MNGRITIRMIQPALAQPDMLRRNMSANSAMNIQMTVNQKKKTTIDHRNVPNVHCMGHLRLIDATYRGPARGYRHHPFWMRPALRSPTRPGRTGTEGRV